jgi:hypothetical protein
MNRTELAGVVLDLLEKETGETYRDLAETASLREDLNLDRRIYAGDLAIMLVHWGPCGADAIELGACAADIDGDGMTDASDLAALLIAWSE